MDWKETVMWLWGWNGLDGNCDVGCVPGMNWMVTVLYAGMDWMVIVL
jgi:hypothetical protein